MLFALTLGICAAITLFCMSYSIYALFLHHTSPGLLPSSNPHNTLTPNDPDNTSTDHHDGNDSDDDHDGVLLPGECDLDLVAGMLGVSTTYVSTLFERGKLPLPCSYDPLRWEKTEIESWLEKNVHDRVTLVLFFCLQPLDPAYGGTTNKHLNDQVNQLLARMSSKETRIVLRRFLSESPTSEHPESEHQRGQALLEALIEALFVESLANNHPNALDTQIKDAYRLFRQQETGEPPENASNPADISSGEKKFLESFAQNIAGADGPETPPSEDDPIPDFVLPSPDGFSWDDWEQPNVPFLWTLTDIAHALGSDFETAKRWYREGNIPKPAWNDDITWHGHTIKLLIWRGTEIKPWIDNVTALTNKILKSLPDTTPDNPTPDQVSDTTPVDPTPDSTIQDDLPPNTIDLTLHKAGLCDLSDIADTLGHDSATLRQWHYEGCPGHPMPYPDLIEKSVPYWFYDGKIADWINTLPASLTKTRNRTSPSLDPKLALDPHNLTQPPQPSESPESTDHTLPIEPTLPDTNLVSLPEIASITGIPIPTLRDWAVHGVFCPPLDISPPTAPGYGYWHRDTIIPWLARHDARNKNTRLQNKHPEDQAKDKTKSLDRPCFRGPTIRQGEETNMGKLWDETQRNFERLGDTATQTDLANLAGDYPQLLAHATELDRLPDWLIKTADRLALAGFWNAFKVDTNTITSNTPGAAFARGAHGLWLYRNGTLEDAGACLATAARSRLLPQNARDLFTLRNAHVLQISAGCNIALPGLATLARQEGPVSVQARYWIANAALLQADSRGCLATMPTPDELPALTGDYWINVGYAHFQCAQIDKAVEAYEQSLAYARINSSVVAEGEALAYLARVQAWSDPDAAKTHAHEAIRLTQQTGNLIDEQKACVALAIASAGTVPDEEFHTTLQKAQDLAYRTGNHRSTLSASVARAWHAAVQNDNDALYRSIQTIENQAAAVSSGQHWADITRAWLPGQTRENAELAARWEWLDSPEDTMRRWRELLDNRKTLAS